MAASGPGSPKWRTGRTRQWGATRYLRREHPVTRRRHCDGGAACARDGSDWIFGGRVSARRRWTAASHGDQSAAIGVGRGSRTFWCRLSSAYLFLGRWGELMRSTAIVLESGFGGSAGISPPPPSLSAPRPTGRSVQAGGCSSLRCGYVQAHSVRLPRCSGSAPSRLRKRAALFRAVSARAREP